MRMTISTLATDMLVILLACLGFANRTNAENRASFYDPIQRKIEGWTVMIDSLVECLT